MSAPDIEPDGSEEISPERRGNLDINRNKIEDLFSNPNTLDEAFRGYESSTERNLLDNPSYQLLFTNHFRNATKVCMLCGIEAVQPDKEYIGAAPSPKLKATRAGNTYIPSTGRGVTLYFENNNLELYLDDDPYNEVRERNQKTDLDRFVEGEYIDLCAPGKRGNRWQELQLSEEEKTGKDRWLHRAFCHLLNTADDAQFSIYEKDGFYLLVKKATDGQNSDKKVLIRTNHPLLKQLACLPTDKRNSFRFDDIQESPLFGVKYNPRHRSNSRSLFHAYTMGKWGMIWKGGDYKNISESDFEEYQKRKSESKKD